MANIIPNQLIFTDKASLKAYELISQTNNENLNLRLFIVGGSCRGFQYGFALDETINPDDIVTEKKIEPKKKVKLIIDPLSFLYLSKAEVDYIDTPQYARFVVNNPNVKTTCGCLSVKQESETSLH